MWKDTIFWSEYIGYYVKTILGNDYCVSVTTVLSAIDMNGYDHTDKWYCLETGTSLIVFQWMDAGKPPLHESITKRHDLDEEFPHEISEQIISDQAAEIKALEEKLAKRNKWQDTPPDRDCLCWIKTHSGGIYGGTWKKSLREIHINELIYSPIFIKQYCIAQYPEG